MSRKDDALEYHRRGRKGKLEVVPTKPLVSQIDLSLAYTPGVAEPCLEIAKNEDASWEYTARGNLVGVISNGTAVLGLGDIGPAAGKPVMEGKACLFKKFADIDVFDLEIAEKDVDKFCDIVAALEPTFGGINLEDVAAPACFEIEEKLRKRMRIPVFHDDQHGTAIISGAGLLNAAQLAGKQLADMKLVVSGAGAGAIACVDFFCSLGMKAEHVVLVDSKGVVHKGRTDLNRHKQKFAIPDDGRRTLRDAMHGADMFMGLSVAGTVTPDMLMGMAERPIIFALANPDPEIAYPDAIAARPDALVATGRSDYPNQVNNVLGFPYIFRGALDCRATGVSEADEARGRARARAAHARAGARYGDPRVRRKIAQDGSGVLHPETVRSARPVVGRAGGRQGGDGIGRRADPVRHRRVSRAADVEGLECRVLDHAHDRSRGAARSEAHRVPARGQPAPVARDPADRRREHRAADPARPVSTRSPRCATRCRSICSSAARR